MPLAILLLLRERPFDETYSTLLGGTLFGWMAWRTGSILYAFLLHLYLMTLIVVAASAAA